MTPEQWAQIRHLYEAVSEQTVEAQPAYLQAYGPDLFVRATVAQMLADRDALPGFLETPLLPLPALHDEALHDAAGRRIGAYLLERELGRGGMGVVYLAARADDVYQKEVAIKLLWPGLPEDQKRFQRERQILADLDHPGIARLLDGNVTPEGWPYIVMEYVAGLPITEFCDEYWLDCTARIQLLIKVCAAVEYAHQQRVIHRDLKPANLLVTPDGEPRLLDFGIAKLLDAEFPAKFTLSTQTGMRAMTPDYASPEQMRGEEIAPASDVYSLGVLLYELLTGQRPFRLDDKPLHEAVRIVSEDDPPRPSDALRQRMKEERGRMKPEKPAEALSPHHSSFLPHPAELCGDLDNIVLRALRKTPTERYPTVAALRADLERHLRHETVSAREPTFTYRANRFVRRNRLGVTVAALLLAGLLIALGAALWQAHTARLEARQARRMLYLAQMQQAARQLEQGGFAELRATLEQWQPTAGAEDVRGFEWFYLLREAHRERFELNHPDWVYGVAYSPDSQKVASACNDGIVRVWAATTGQQLLAFRNHGTRVIDVTFSPDGKSIASAGEDHTLRFWDAATGQERWKLDIGGINQYSLAFSPDGSRLAVSAERDLAVFQVTNQQRLFSRRNELPIQKIVFFPDGQKIASAGQDQMVKVWDATTGRVLHSVVAHPGTFVFAVAVSPDGKLIASGGNDQLNNRKVARLWDATTLREIKTFAGHENSVRSVAFSPDGTRLITASADRTVKVWDIATGQEVKTFRGHTNRIQNMTIAPDGKHIASASDDRTVRIWSLDPTEDPAEILTGHRARIMPVALSPDGTMVATGSADTEAKLWNLATGQLRHTLSGFQEEVYSLAFAPDSQTLATGANDDTLRFWSTATGQAVNAISTRIAPLAFTPAGRPISAVPRGTALELRDVETGQPLFTLPEAGLLVRKLKFSADGRHLVTITAQGTGTIWDAAMLQPLVKFGAAQAGFTEVVLSADARVLITESRMQMTERWDTHTGKRLYGLSHSKNVAGALSVSPDGRWLATGGSGTTVLLRDAATGRTVSTWHGHHAPVTLGAFSPDGKWLVTTSESGELKLWDIQTRQAIQTFHTTGEAIYSLVFAPDSRTFATGGGEDVIKLWDLHAPDPLRLYHGHAHDILEVLYAPDGMRFLSRDADGWLLVHDITSGQELARHNSTPQGGNPYSTAFSPDGTRLMLGYVTPAIINVATGEQELLLKGHKDITWTTRFAPDGKTIATASWDKTARLWDAQTGAELAKLTGHQAAVTAAAYSPDGKLLVTGGDDRNIRLWEVATGRELGMFTGHADTIRAVTFSPDGRRLASGGNDQTVRVWDVESGQELLTLHGHTDEVWSVAFAPDGRTLVSGSWDQTVRVWRTAERYREP